MDGSEKEQQPHKAWRTSSIALSIFLFPPFSALPSSPVFSLSIWIVSIWFRSTDFEILFASAIVSSFLSAYRSPRLRCFVMNNLSVLSFMYEVIVIVISINRFCIWICIICRREEFSDPGNLLASICHLGQPSLSRFGCIHVNRIYGPSANEEFIHWLHRAEASQGHVGTVDQ